MSTMRRRSQTGPRTDTTYDIYVYMTEGKYPDGANENARRNLRKRSKMFKLKGSEVFHVSTTKDKFGKDVQRERLVLTDNAKRNAVISELHVDEKGNTSCNPFKTIMADHEGRNEDNEYSFRAIFL